MKGKEYFDRLSEIEKKQFKENTGKEFDKIMTSFFFNWELFLWFSGFDWTSSSQGFYYWYKISKLYKD